MLTEGILAHLMQENAVVVSRNIPLTISFRKRDEKSSFFTVYS